MFMSISLELQSPFIRGTPARLSGFACGLAERIGEIGSGRDLCLDIGARLDQRCVEENTSLRLLSLFSRCSSSSFHDSSRTSILGLLQYFVVSEYRIELSIIDGVLVD